MELKQPTSKAWIKAEDCRNGINAVFKAAGSHTTKDGEEMAILIFSSDLAEETILPAEWRTTDLTKAIKAYGLNTDAWLEKPFILKNTSNKNIAVLPQEEYIKNA